MAKKSREELESLKSFCDSTYNGVYGHKLYVNTGKVFDPENVELGYCYKYTNEKTNRSEYQIFTASVNSPYTDFRILMHEYGHIYLGHLDGIHENLDRRLCELFQNNREELVEKLQRTLGLDAEYAETLVDRVIDDPNLNHQLHNIAMDMEVNSKLLSVEDIEEMEADISATYPKFNTELLEYLEEHSELTEEQKKELDEAVKKLDNATKVKLILPCRCQTSDGTPFPDNLTYPDYLIMMVNSLDQFVKMMASLSAGMGLDGNLTDEDIRNILNNPNRDWKNASKEYKQGYQDALNESHNGKAGNKSNRPTNSNPDGTDTKEQQDYDQGYNDALEDLRSQCSGGDPVGQLLNSVMGMSSGNLGGKSKFTVPAENEGSNAKGLGPWQPKVDHNDPRPGTRDHSSESREEADQKRRVGQITAGGGIGCGNSGGSDVVRAVDKSSDLVEMALKEVIHNMRNRVIKLSTKKDLMRNYNRGIVRTVISPTVMRKIHIANEQKIVFLLDVSGSMDTALIDRILHTIRVSLKRLSLSLKYDIITWSTHLEDHLRDLDPRQSVPEISSGGGTEIASGIKYFRENYGPEATLIVISDFEDRLQEWNNEESQMNNYLIYGFNYGTNQWGTSVNDIPWKNLKLRNFNNKFKDVN